MNTRTEIEIKILRSGDISALDSVEADVFDGPILEREKREFLEDDRHHLAVAINSDTVVGIASGVHYVHPDKTAELWINEVGVAPQFQRTGIGKALLNALLKHGQTLGCDEAWVLTSSDNSAARRLYASAGGREQEQPVYFSFDLQDILGS